MTKASRNTHKLAKLEALAGVRATVARARLARATRDEARLARDIAALTDRRSAASEQIANEATPEMSMIAATGAWLRASEADIRRLNVQLAALRARTETIRSETTRDIARHAVTERLLKDARQSQARARAARAADEGEP